MTQDIPGGPSRTPVIQVLPQHTGIPGEYKMFYKLFHVEQSDYS
jgi:hypothetical protein